MKHDSQLELANGYAKQVLIQQKNKSYKLYS